MTTSIIKVSGLTLDSAGRTVLDAIDLDVRRGEVLAVMGPGGSGKSALFRTICDYPRRIDRHCGSIEMAGDHEPVYIPQNLGTFVGTAGDQLFRFVPPITFEGPRGRQEWLRRALRDWPRLLPLLEIFGDELRCLSRYELALLGVASAILADGELIVFDEPTASLDGEEASAVLELIERLAAERTVVLITHNQKHARRVADRVALIAGGQIIEVARVDDFFSNPQRPETEVYIRTGGCTVGDPSLLPSDGYLQESAATGFVSSAAGPRGFHWVIEGALGGSPQPGIVEEIEVDLEALVRCGVDRLVTLTEYELDPSPVAAAGLETIFFPIVDMRAPALEDAAELLEEVTSLVEGGEVVVFHCKAGIGRTGTMLAAYLIFHGASDSEALESVRKIHPRWVQSREQEAFLASFHQWLASRRSMSP